MRIYTDGSCLGNPGPGGWAWAVDQFYYNSGHESHTTNQRMELTAVLQALSENNDYADLTIVTDSAYIVNCFNQEWYEQWTSNGTKIKTGERVANWDLWSGIFENNGFDVTFEKVRGHSGDPMNDLVDSLARAGAEHERLQSYRSRSKGPRKNR